MASGHRYSSDSEEEVLAETLRSLEELIKEVDHPAARRPAAPDNGDAGARAVEDDEDSGPILEHRLPPRRSAPVVADQADDGPEIEHRLPPRARSEYMTDARPDRAHNRNNDTHKQPQRGLYELELPPAEPIEPQDEQAAEPPAAPASEVSTLSISDTGPRPAFDDAPARSEPAPAAAPPAASAPAADDDDFPVLEQVAVLPTHRTPGTTAGRRQRDAGEARPAVASSALAQLTDTTIARLGTEIRRATGHELDQHARSKMRQMLRSALAEWAERLAQRIKDGRSPVD